MNVMRFTIIDGEQAISFVDTCDMLAALVVTCAEDPRDIDELLSKCNRYAPGFCNWARNGLAIFDEHNAPGRLDAVHEELRTLPPHEVPLFRVLDETLREASLQPVKAGVVLFNLPERRIVQIHNTWAEVNRRGQLPVVGDSPDRPRYIAYELPEAWSVRP